jgi:hypothetical protein
MWNGLLILMESLHGIGSMLIFRVAQAVHGLCFPRETSVHVASFRSDYETTQTSLTIKLAPC